MPESEFPPIDEERLRESEDWDDEDEELDPDWYPLELVAPGLVEVAEEEEEDETD